MTESPCGCCAGTETVTPTATFNPPGLPALTRRVGTHGRFLESMLARLSGRDGLADLTTRDTDDIGIALLDGWAAVADVLTFYQERIANEGYLRTAVEPESLVQLGRLVGYQPRPAIGSSVYLAYTLDPGSHTTVPAGSQARSVPAQGELPQTFETTEDFEAREEWNTLAVRRTKPPAIDAATVRGDLTQLVVAGSAANLKPADRLVFLFGAAEAPAARTVADARPDFPTGTTAVKLVPLAADTGNLAAARRRLTEAVAEALARTPSSSTADDTVGLLTGLAVSYTHLTLPTTPYV